jgi:anti-sigma regulatory factor (Ser/Thr protein kinase)
VETRVPYTQQGASAARKWLKEQLRDRISASVLDDLLVCASELVTNSHQHAPADDTDGILISLRLDPCHVRVDVLDNGSPLIPTMREAEVTDIHGRGLWLVEQLSFCWGSYDTTTGGAVWFEFRTQVKDLPEAKPPDIQEISCGDLSALKAAAGHRRLTHGELSSGHPRRLSLRTPMTDPMIMTIATAVAGKAVEVAGEPAREAIAALVRKVRDRLRGHPRDEAALAALTEDPDSAERLAAFEAVLQQAITADPAFGDELRALWNQARMHVSAEQDGVVNVFHGRAGKSIQLRDVHGDLTIN